MARNDDNLRTRSNEDRDHQSTVQRTGSERDRRRDRVIGTVKERPYTAAALATVAAGAAAFFLTRSKSDKPLMNWGQETQGDHVKGAGAFKPQGSTTRDRSLETASASPSSSAGMGAGSAGTSPSAVQASTLSNRGSSTSASSTGGTATGSRDNPNSGTSNTIGAGVSGGSNASGGGMTGDANSAGGTKAGGTGLDATGKDQTKAGSVSYGA